MPEPAEQQCHRLEPSSKMLVPRANPKREHKHALVLFFHSQNLSVQRGDPVAKGSGFAPLFLFFTPKAWGTREFAAPEHGLGKLVLGNDLGKMVWGMIFRAVLGMEGGGKRWSQALFKEYGAEDDGGKQICCIRKQSFAEKEPLGLILP